MGLDITWYRGLTESPDEPREEDGEIKDYDNAVQFYIHDKPESWTAYAGNLRGDIAYRFEESDGFRAGSYGGFSRFRDILAGIGGFKDMPIEKVSFATERYVGDVTGLPFYEMVCFTDCEGTLGADVCANLAKDFEAMRPKFIDAIQVFDGATRDYYEGRYNDWTNAFKQASDRGAVRYH